MSVWSWGSFIAYILFGIFTFYQQLHLKSFNGSSRGFEAALVVSASLGTLTGIVFLVIYAWKVSWWPPIVMLGTTLTLGAFVGVFLERVFGSATVSLAGFIGWPICAYLMFRFMPS